MESKKIDLNAPLLSVRLNRRTRTSQPVRQLSLPLPQSEWELTEVVKPVAVPFVWEHIPGRPKDGSESFGSPQEEPSVTPLFPRGRTFEDKKQFSGEQFKPRTVCRPNTEAPPINETVKDLNMKKNSASSLSDDEAYSDALDTMPESDSFSWNCSVSGLSGYDGPYAKSSFTADPKTREIMMTRFLPAARAMVLETEQKKQHMVSNLPRPTKKVLSGELRPLLELYGSNTALHRTQYKGGIGSEEEEDEYIDHGRKSFKACGLLPRLCVKNSLCLLDPVPGMKSRAQSPISSGPEFRRMARTAYSGPLPQTHHETQDWNDIYWKNIQSRVQPRELAENKLSGVSNDSNKIKGLSPQRCSRGGAISPYRNEKPQSPFYDGAKFLGIPKIVKDNKVNRFDSIDKESDKQDASLNQICKKGSSSVAALVEKTLYIDSPNDVEMPISDLALSEVKGVDTISKKTLEECRQVEGFPTHKSVFQGEKNVKTKAVGSPDADLPSYLHISNKKTRSHSNLLVKHDQKVDQEQRSMHSLVFHPKDNLGKNENTKKVNNQVKSSVGSLKSPKPPPLPKSPSESWLWRTLPSVSLRNPFSQDQPKKQDKKTSATGAKWETIVKTSHVHHEHLRYSEELVSHVPQHSKS